MKHPALLAFVLGAIAGCGRAADPAPVSARLTSPPAVAALAPAAPAPAGTRCDDMTAIQCGLAPRCVLEQVPTSWSPRYRCRDGAGPCEGGVAQFDAPAFERDCAARRGCRYDEPRCFCGCTAQTRVAGPNQACSCACGGGTAARCVSST